mmetsp:Transcript_21001/g.50641  ORF Transcript_21001/g.50641 Transcript_21001/m.50641 type:complete len:83 (+) Transcript_21001:615-863(+)
MMDDLCRVVPTLVDDRPDAPPERRTSDEAASRGVERTMLFENDGYGSRRRFPSKNIEPQPHFTVKFCLSFGSLQCDGDHMTK